MHDFDHPQIGGARGDYRLLQWVWQSLRGLNTPKDSWGIPLQTRIGQNWFEPTVVPNAQALVDYVTSKTDSWVTRHGAPYVTVSVPYYWRLRDSEPESFTPSYFSFEVYQKDPHVRT